MQFVADGLLLGGMIGLGAIGVTLTYSILRFANFAHGEFVTAGAYGALAMTGVIGAIAGRGMPLGPFSFGWHVLLASLLAIAVIAMAILLCFAYSDRIQRLLGQGGTDIAVRLSAFIMFCLGLQILWSGGNELLRSVLSAGPVPSLPAP